MTAEAIADEGTRNHRAELQQTGLLRMQRLATTLFCAMLLLFVASAYYQRTVPLLHWLRAFAEAAVVGAAADWYAVVALFRRPFGLRLPHTAIVPARKDAIAEGLGEFVERNFLTQENVGRQLEQQNSAAALGRWLSDGQNRTALARAFCEFLPGVLAAAEEEQVHRMLDRTLMSQLSRFDPLNVAAHFLEHLTDAGRDQALLEHALEAGRQWILGNRGLIRAKFAQASRLTPAFVDQYLAAKWINGVVCLINDILRNPQHELRARFHLATEDLIEKLRSSAPFRQQAKPVVDDLLAYARGEQAHRAIWANLRAAVEADVGSDRSILREQIANALHLLGGQLSADPSIQRKLNTWWVRAAQDMVPRVRREISLLIGSVIKRWNASEVSARIELEIGRDLQYIRINGTLVGGLAGLVLDGLSTLSGF